MGFIANAVVEKTTWYPLTLGWLVVLSGIGMFFGSTYLLLSTNVGARLGFLIVGAITTGFIAILAFLWVTTATPLNVFKGRQAEWKPVAVVQRVDDSKIEDVRTIKEKGTKLSSTEYANVKAAADTILAPIDPNAHSGSEKPASVAEDLPSVDVLVTEIYEVGGSSPNPLNFEFSHTPQFAAAKFCAIDEVKAQTAFRNTCDTSDTANSGVLILEKDLGSLRQPPMFLFLGSSTLFILFLLALHWRERDLQEQTIEEEETTEEKEESEAEVSS